jgi:hypothetical protein
MWESCGITAKRSGISWFNVFMHLSKLVMLTLSSPEKYFNMELLYVIMNYSERQEKFLWWKGPPVGFRQPLAFNYFFRLDI